MLIVLIMGLITRAGGHIARMMWTRALYRGGNVDEENEISLDETKKNKKSKIKASFHLKG